MSAVKRPSWVGKWAVRTLTMSAHSRSNNDFDAASELYNDAALLYMLCAAVSCWVRVIFWAASPAILLSNTSFSSMETLVYCCPVASEAYAHRQLIFTEAGAEGEKHRWKNSPSVSPGNCCSNPDLDDAVLAKDNLRSLGSMTGLNLWLSAGRTN